MGLIMRAFNHTCIGESHIKSGKVCQDYSLTINLDGLTAAVVCDGHGSQRYFRSDVGAKLAAETTAELIKEFVDDFDKSQIVGKHFTQCYAKTDAQKYKENDLSPIFEQLFKAIVTTWYQKIEQHAKENPITEKEREHCEAEWIDEFENGIKIEKSYGCTLMASVFVPEYWFAFHIGDGKMISLQGNPIFMEPVPWDDRCFLNKTTSLCDTDPLNEFRYCYCGDGSFPDAVFLGSDGIDDTFGEGDNLAEFYVKIAKGIIENGEEKTSEDIKKLLPDLSKRGSQDDMSLAVVFDIDKMSNTILAYNSFIVKKIENEISIKKENVKKFEKEQDAKNVEYRKALLTKDAAKNWLSSKKTEYENAIKEYKETEEKINKILEFFTGTKRKVKSLEDAVKQAETNLSKAEKEFSYSEKALQIAQNELQEAQTELETLLKKKIKMEN